MDLLCALLVIVATFVTIYWFLTKTYDYWQMQRIPCLPSPLPGFGHMWPVISLKHNMTSFTLEAYKRASGSMIGFYFMRKPGLIIRDPELVKSVMITNFSNFRANGIVLNEKTDPVLSKNPFFIDEYHRWKESRVRTISHLSSKNLKYLFDIVKDVCANMDDYIDRKIKAGQDSFELKEHFTRYTGEIVANSAFGIKGHSFEDNPDPLAFVNMAKIIFEPTVINGVKQALSFYLPDIAGLLHLSFIPPNADAYFRENVRAILKQRRQSNLVPNDYLQFCANSNSEEDLEGVVADILIFYADVYETSSTAMAVLFYNLSLNQEIQEKLREHILSTIEENNNEITYESLKNMTYLEQVLFESLRVIPPLGSLVKVCTEDITLQGSDGLQCYVQSGTTVVVPVMALHNDPKYWKDPHIFDPERFNSENQKNHTEGAYISFGTGPRMCLGMRLAIVMVKLATASILSKYLIQHSSKTKIPFEMESTSIITYIKGGLWGKFEKL